LASWLILKENIMDTMHTWALWRLLMLALIALPFVIAVMIAGFRQQHAKTANASAEPDDGRISSAISGPGAWRAEVDSQVEMRRVANAVVVDQRAA
jgi:hypothetical protein